MTALKHSEPAQQLLAVHGDVRRGLHDMTGQKLAADSVDHMEL